MEIWQYTFMQNALLASLLGSIACGIVGTLVVTKRIVSVSGSIAHCAFGGIGIGYYLGINPLFAVLPFCLCAAIAIGLLTEKTKISVDSLTGMFWSFCMALGILLIGLKEGYTPDLFSYLFGNILTVSQADILTIGILDCFILLVTLLFHKEILAIIFDEEHTKLSGLPALFLNLLILCLVALTVVILIRIVGIILVLALLTIPASIAKLYTRSFWKMMFLSSVIGMFLTLGGLWISYQCNLASGASIIMLGTLVFLLAYFIHHKRQHVKK